MSERDRHTMQKVGGLDTVGDKVNEIRAFAYTDDVESDDLPRSPIGDHRKVTLVREDGCTLRSAYSAKEEGSEYFSICGLSRSSSGYIGADDGSTQRQDSVTIFNDRGGVEESITTLFPENAFADDDKAFATSAEEQEEEVEEEEEEEVHWEKDHELNQEKVVDTGSKGEDIFSNVSTKRDKEKNPPLKEGDRSGGVEDNSQQSASEHVNKNTCRDAETVGPIFSLPCDEGPEKTPHAPCQECLVHERDTDMYQKTIDSLRSTIEYLSHDAQDQIESLEEEIRKLKVQHTEQVSSLLRENRSMWQELRRVKERDQNLASQDEENPITSYTGKTKQKSKPKIVIPMAASVSQGMTSPAGYSPLAAGRLMHYKSTP